MKFQPVFIEATTIDDCWHRLLWELYHKGRKYLITKGSFEGTHRHAFDFVSGVITNPHERPLAPRMSEGSNLPPPTDENSIENYFVNYLMSDVLPENTHYTYGGYIRGNSKLCKLDQLSWIINHFKKTGFGSEHNYISIGNGEDLLNYDIPYSNDSERRTTCCLRGLDFRIIEEEFFCCLGCNREYPKEEHDYIIAKRRRHIHFDFDCDCFKEGFTRIIKSFLTTNGYWRSWDIFAFPENIGGITLLNEYVAQELEINPGPITFSSKSLHAYEHAFEYIKNRLGVNND